MTETVKDVFGREFQFWIVHASVHGFDEEVVVAAVVLARVENRVYRTERIFLFKPDCGKTSNPPRQRCFPEYHLYVKLRRI